jgi:dipeptidase D
MLENLQPKPLWKYFSALCAIPRPSKHENLAVRFIQETATQLGLQSQIDKVGNILVIKPASAGKENRPSVALQSHLDMVPQKNSGTEHDFLLDPISAYIDNEWVKAKGTTLGADNGIGVASMLAILEDREIQHGPIEALFTIDEETGMTGAMHLSSSFLQSKLLINLDSEDDDELCIGCAGGINATATLLSSVDTTGSDRIAFNLALKGLRGGHSGVDIHLGRGNAIKLLNRILFMAVEKFDIRLSSFTGGTVRNAIPREAFATIVIPSLYKNDFMSFISGIQKTLQKELASTDPDLIIEMSDTELPEQVLTNPAQDNLIRAIYACPNGVFSMSSQFPDVVESSNNLSILQSENGHSQILCLLRSSIESKREDLGNTLLSALSLAEAHVEFSDGYPGWSPDPDSKLLKLTQSIYKDMFSQNPAVKVIHAGLECGIIGAKYPEIDMISLGPTIRYPHSPDEKVHIGSVTKYWNFLKAILEKL